MIEQIIERICTQADSREQDRAAARRAFADTIAVMLAGWREPVSRAALRYGAGSAVELVTGQGASSPEQAAFIHATSGHALDYDDVHLVSVTHPSVVIAPALMALTPWRADRRAVMDAYGVGVSVNIALGRAMGFAHYAQGWHATSTIGPIAAAAAGAHLLGLDERATRSALALAAAQSGGLQRNFGAMAKPIQAGNAAAAGVRAVLLAADGVSGDADVFGEQGFIDLYGGEGNAIGALGPDDVHSISVKLFPCCYAAHRPISAAFNARAALDGLPLASIERIDLLAPAETLKPLRVFDPQTGNEGKFCASYVLAVALLQGHVGLSDFTDEAVRRPHVRALMDKITVSRSPCAVGEAASLESGQVDVRLHRRGATIEGSCALYPGSPQDPATPAQLETKLADCAEVYSDSGRLRITAADIHRITDSLGAQPTVQSVA